MNSDLKDQNKLEIKLKPEYERTDINTIEPAIEREKLKLNEDEETRRSAWLKKSDTVETVITQESNNKIELDETFTVSQTDTKPFIPIEIEKQYLRVGNKFYNSKNTNLIAFEDKGNKLETRSNSENIAESMIRIAEARGWDEIKVSGSETFRREIWIKATSRGMSIKGYEPTEQDKAELEKRMKESQANKLENTDKSFRGRENQTNIGNTNSHQSPKNNENILINHGAAKYLHDKNNTDSYYVTTRNGSNQEKTLWGVDLERALNESGAEIGDKIFIQNEGKKTVTVDVPIRNSAGEIIDIEKKEAIRNSWNIKMAETFSKESPHEAVKKYPELAGSAATAAAIDKKAEIDGLTPEQRAIVSARVRQNIVNSIEHGDIPTINIRESVETRRDKEQQQEKEYSR